MKTELEFTLTVLLFGILKFVNAECGTEKLTANSWRQEYQNVGIVPRERCAWTFDSPINERSVLILRIRSLSTSTRHGFLILPNGTRVDISNYRKYVGKCMKFVRKGFKSIGCLEDLEDDFCFATITETEIWPPVLSSSVEFGYINRAGKYVYPFKFIYDYRYLKCLNGTYLPDIEPTVAVSTDNYYVSTIVLSILMVIFFLIALVTSYLLWKKSRKPILQNNQIALAVQNNNKEESVYENPNNLEAELISKQKNSYSKIEESSCKADDDDDNSTYAIIPAAANRPKQVIQNVLYHSYENTSELPQPKKDQS